MSFFRYPGGKAKISAKILSKFAYGSRKDTQYREPFFGGGGIGLKLIDANPHISDVWVNDKDVGIACLWTAVSSHPDLLIQKIKSFTPQVNTFYEIKKELLAINQMPSSVEDILDIGFKKLAIHQISYSGLGTKSGGPLGGEKQESKYKVDCRWSPDYICKKVTNLNRKLNSIEFRCTNLDFTVLIEDDSKKCFLYLDPPYYVKGGDLYQHSFVEHDHQRLAHALSKTKHTWVLSYDDCPEIRKLYEWATVEVFDNHCTIRQTKNKLTGGHLSPKKGELLITPKDYT